MNITDLDPDLLLRGGRHAVAASILALLWAAETIVPMYGGRRRRLSHGAVNIGMALVNGLVAYGAAFGLLALTEASLHHRVGLLHRLDAPVWLTWLLALVLFDAWQYAWHRMSHRVPFLWRFHAVHHSDSEMDASSGVRFHTVEIVISTIARMAIVPLLGLTIPQLLLYELLSLPIILFHHSNIRLSNGIDRLLRWLIVTPWMHWVHHSRWQPETDSNYSSLLSVWDRLFGSFRLNPEPASIRLGLDGWEHAERRGLRGLLEAPFRGKIDSDTSGELSKQGEA